MDVYRELVVSIRELGLDRSIVKRLPLEVLLQSQNTIAVITTEQNPAVATPTTTAVYTEIISDEGAEQTKALICAC